MNYPFKSFNHAELLRSMGRRALNRLLEPFREDMARAGVKLPPAATADPAFFESVAQLLRAPAQLPGPLVEVLAAMEEMSTPQGREQLEAGADRAGVAMLFAPDSTHAEVALQFWLQQPRLFARIHNLHRLERVTAFELFEPAPPGCERPPFRAPEATALEQLTAALDEWFTLHDRGRESTRVEVYYLPACQDGFGPAQQGTGLDRGEYLFLVRHGDTLTRTASVTGRKTEILHYRPERDDVVGYRPLMDQLRIHARTRGERDLYVRQFGRLLRGREDYFADITAYTLEPLRHEGPEALRTDDIPGLKKMVLTKLEVLEDPALGHKTVHLADDLFACDGFPPDTGTLTRAEFECHFAASRKPRRLQIRLPNMLKLGRHADAHLVTRFLRQRGYHAGNKLQ